MTRRVVLDTNVIVSGLGWSGPAARIIDAVLAGRCTLVTSPALLDELRRVLAYPKLAPVFPDCERVLDLISTVAVVTHPERILAVAPDEEDNRVLEAAVSGDAELVVTGDAGLLGLDTVEGIAIVTPAVFSSMLSAE